MSDRIAFFIGSNTAFNVRRDLSNIGWMLSKDFDLDLITTDPEGFGDGVSDHFRLVGTEGQSTYPGSVAILREYLRSNDPAVLSNIIKPPEHGVVVSTVGRRYGVPVVYRYSGDRFYDYVVNRGIKRVLYFGLSNVVGQVPLALADQHITLGPTGTERLMARGVESDYITELPPPIDETRFNSPRCPSELDIPSNRSVALFVGRFTRLKGFKALERAIPAVIERREDIHFVLVGGTSMPSVKSQYRDHVTVVGRVDPDQMPGYFHAADVLVHPSLTEGIPRVVLEALATDTPVVVRDVGDVRAATENTFRTQSAFIDLICKFEELDIDEVNPFIRCTLKDQYINFFEQF